MPRYIDLDKLFEVPEGGWESDFEETVWKAIHDEESSLVKDYLNSFPSTEIPGVCKVYGIYASGCTYDLGYGEDDYDTNLFCITDSKEVANSYVKAVASTFLKRQAHDGDLWEYEVINRSGLLGVEATGGYDGGVMFYATELTVLKDTVDAELPTTEELRIIIEKEQEDYDKKMEDYIRKMDQEVEE